MISKRLADALCSRGRLLALLVLIGGWFLAPTYFVDGDNAEFSTLSVTGGVAHPPGYPLYVLYLRAMSWLPGESAAHVAARATAVLGATTVLVLYAACRAWGAKPWASTIAVAIFSGAPIVLRLYTAAEVFGLNSLVVSVVLLGSAMNGPVRGAPRIALLAFVAGLGLCNHQTCVLVAPIGLIGAIRGVRESRLGVPAVLGLAAAALVLGLTPYAYTFRAPHSAASWGHVDSFRDLLALFTRQDYGGVGAFSPIPGEPHPVANLVLLGESLGRGWLWLPAVAGVAALARQIKSSDGEPRAGWIALALSFCLAGPLLVIRFNIVPVGIGAAVCERFHVLPLMLLVIPVAMAFHHLGDTLATRVRLSVFRHGFVQHGLGGLVFLATAGLSLPHLLATHSPAVQRGVENLLRPLPPDAVVICMADDLHFGALYAQQVEHIRPDVDVIAWPMPSLPWYLAWFAARGLVIDPHAGGPDQPSVRVARQVFASGRPLFVDSRMGNILAEFPTYPFGLVFRVLPPGTSTPTLDIVLAENRALLETFDLGYPRPTLDASYAVAVHIRYARTWDILARALRDANRSDDARWAREVRDRLALEPDQAASTR